MGSWIVKSVLLLLAVGAVLAGVILLGRLAREDLRDRDRYTVAFADIECVPPPGLTRTEFLDEVQYFGLLPARLRLLEETLVGQLRECFARHPWVESVAAVEVVPPRHVRVRLHYRTPVLAVPLAGDIRAVDVHGILLPRSAATQGLPLFAGYAAPPAGPVGTPWGDAAVEAAARGTRR